MLFKDFKKAITLLQSCVELQNKCNGILNDSIFNEHNELITKLLVEIYNEYSVNYILNEWLCGNKSPIIFTNNEGVTVEVPIVSINELWKAMETYGNLKESI